MRSMAFILTFIFVAMAVAGDLKNDFANSYEQASIPDFLPHVGSALSGRCYLASASNKEMASVLMVSFEEEGFEVVPFDAENKRADFFDHMSYEEVLKNFPIVKRMFFAVIETADGAVIEGVSGANQYRGEIRESEKYMILKVFINNKIIKYCNYVKA